MSRFNDFAVSHCFDGKIFSFDDTFETREFILGQIAYTFKCSSCNASMPPYVYLTFIHGPFILVDQSDTANDLILFIDTVTFISWFSDFDISLALFSRHS